MQEFKYQNYTSCPNQRPILRARRRFSPRVYNYTQNASGNR